MDMAAVETGIERTEIRRRNFIPPNAMPYSTPLDVTYDSGEFENILDEHYDLPIGMGSRHAAKHLKRMEKYEA